MLSAAGPLGVVGVVGVALVRGGAASWMRGTELRPTSSAAGAPLATGASGSKLGAGLQLGSALCCPG